MDSKGLRGLYTPHMFEIGMAIISLKGVLVYLTKKGYPMFKTQTGLRHLFHLV